VNGLQGRCRCASVNLQWFWRGAGVGGVRAWRARSRRVGPASCSMKRLRRARTHVHREREGRQQDERGRDGGGLLVHRASFTGHRGRAWPWGACFGRAPGDVVTTGSWGARAHGCVWLSGTSWGGVKEGEGLQGSLVAQLHGQERSHHSWPPMESIERDKEKGRARVSWGGFDVVQGC
jgi:hypothetical protein